MQDRLSYVVVKVCGAPDMGGYSGKAVVVRDGNNFTLQSAAQTALPPFSGDCHRRQIHRVFMTLV